MFYATMCNVLGIYIFFRLIFSNNNNFGKEGGELKFFVGKMES